MADRSSGSITIHGTITKIGDLTHLVEMLATSIPCDSQTGNRIDDEVEAMQAILDAANAGKPLALFDDDLPGGEMEEITNAAALASLAYVARWEGNYAYSSGCRAWDPKNGPLYGDGWDNDQEQPLLSFKDLEKAMTGRQRIKALRRLIETGRRLRGETYPPLSLSDEVRAYLNEQLAE